MWNKRFIDFMKEWVILSLFLFVFYEILWMLLNSTTGEVSIIPTKMECVADFLVCYFQILLCVFFVHIERKRLMKLPLRYSSLLLLLFVLFVMNICVAIPITCVEIIAYQRIHQVEWSISAHLLNDMILAIVSTLLLTIQLLKKYTIELRIATNKNIQEQKIVNETKLMALQSQIDPHFLFNCLNTSIVLIDIDTNKAKTFITNLADVYRHVLKAPEHYYVDIKDELENLSHYMVLINIRFGNEIEVTIDGTMQVQNTFILRGVLQLLVENAIKHNKRSVKQPLHIRIAMNKCFYIVENDYNPIKVKDGSTGIGQENIKKRYATIGFNNVKFVVENNKYIAYVPVIENENTDN